MDMSVTIVPKSDQLNADDLMAGPITVTVAEVVQGNAEQPVDVHLVEYPGRSYRPSKSMRRVMVMAWGVEANAYAGRRLTLYRNPEIMFGKDKVGGIEISHLSHIDRSLTVALTATRGRRKNFKVDPLTAPVQRDWRAEADFMGGDPEKLRAHWIEARGAGADTETLGYIQGLAQQPPAPTPAETSPMPGVDADGVIDETPALVTNAQLDTLFEALVQAGHETETAHLFVLSEMVGHDVANPRQLTYPEATAILDELVGVGR